MRIVWVALALAGCQFQVVPSTQGTKTTPTGTGTPPGTGTGTPPVTTVSGPLMVEDRFVQDAAPQADVLFVIDDSGLVPDLDDVAAQIPLMVDFFLGSGIDYHLGVVTTDLDDPGTAGVLREYDGLRWVDADTANPIDVLAGLLAVTGTGSATVQVYGATYAALETNAATSNAGFLRDGSELTVIAVGDGHDATIGLTEPDFVTWFEGLRPDPTQRAFSCLLAGGVAPGTTCGATAATLGGIEATVADAGAYEALGIDATGLEQAWVLTSTADPTRIEVTVESASGALLLFAEARFDASGALIGGDWTFDPVTNAVAFVEYVPFAGDTVVVRYKTIP